MLGNMWSKYSFPDSMRAQVPSEIPPTSQNHKDIVCVYSVEFQNTRRVPPQKLEKQKPLFTDVVKIK